MKICNTCSIEKGAESFPKNKRLPGGLGYECKDCAHLRYRDWAQRNGAYCKKRNQDHYLKNKQDILDFRRSDRLVNIEKYRKRDSRLAKKNIVTTRAKTGRRRAARTNAEPRWLTDDHKAFMKVTYAMANELSKLYGVKFHVDHIHPLRGEGFCGLHVPWNLQILPAFDNISKGNRLKAA